MKSINHLFLVLIALVIISCNDDENVNPGVENVKATIFGTIVDESNAAIENAAITLNGNNTTTNENGYFILKDIQVPSSNAYLKATKSAYFDGSRTFQVTANSTLEVKVMLLEKVARNFNASTGGTVQIEGLEVVFDANSIADESGNAYSGDVKAYIKRLNPTQQNFELIMPGNLVGIDANNEEVVLESYGMVAVELEGDNGQALNLADGSSAEITFPLDAALVANAPATIPMWFFDEAKGIWTEEGSATLDNGKYVGTVNHFSFWNCDVPFPLVDITGSIVSDNEPVANASVTIRRANAGSTASTTTNSNGIFSGKVPANEALELVVKDKCGQSVSTSTIGPFTNEVDLGAISVDLEELVVAITGVAVNCDNELIENGILAVNDQQVNSYLPIINGEVNTSFVHCGNNSIQVKVIDTDNLTEGEWTTYEIESNIALDTIAACEAELEEYIRWTIGDREFLIVDGIEANLIGFSYFQLLVSSGSHVFDLQITTENVETDVDWIVETSHSIDSSLFSPNGLSIITDNDNFELIASYYPISSTINFTQFPADTGGLIRGTFNGEFLNSLDDLPQNITGEIKVKRDL